MPDARNFRDVLALGQPEVAERAMRALDLKGDLPQYIDPMLQLHAQLEDLTAPEYWYARRGQLFSAGSNISALAGNVSQVIIGCPSVMPVLAVIERVYLLNVTAAPQGFRVGLTYAGTTTTNANQKPRDARMQGARSALSVNAGNSAVAALTNVASQLVFVPANSTFVLDVPFILTGRTTFAGGLPTLMVESDGVNLPVFAWFSWRERQLLDSEAT